MVFIYPMRDMNTILSRAAKRRRKRAVVSHHFSSAFEERKVLGYIRNLITSRLVRGREGNLVVICSELLGRTAIAEAVQKHAPEVARSEKFVLWADRSINEYEFACPLALTILRGEVLDRIEQRLDQLAGSPGTETTERLEKLKSTFSLSHAEMEVVIFQLLWKTAGIVSDNFNGSYSCVLDMSDLIKLRNHGDVLFGLPRNAFLSVFESGLLFHAGIIERNRSINIELADWCTDYLCGFGTRDLQSEFFMLENCEPLQVADFDVTGDELLVITGLLKGRQGRNLLLYGTPGTGKTSFVRSLAKHFGKKLFTVKVPEKDSAKERLRAVIAAVNLAGKADSIVLVDEADEILNTALLLRTTDSISKGWINTFLDNHGKKVVWISNRSAEIDPSTMRRFSFTLEFRAFDPAKRLKVLRHAVAARGIPGSYFTEEELKSLCRDYSVNAAGIVSAIEAVRIDKRTRKQTALRRIRTILRNHEKAIGGAAAARPEKTFDRYTLDGLNVSANLGSIVDAVKRHVACAEGPARSVSMLLYGMPGTGKSEFVSYLGHMLGREVLLKRASDIQSMWVGQTEKNIAEAFREARERGVVLFFDEADTFLFPRSQASHSWEKSFTNEILTQLENHRGVAIFATNDIDGLDHAALRRFGFKIRFDPLTPEGNLRFYETLLAPMLQEKTGLSAADRKRLEAMGSLTPGDFAAVRNQVSLLGAETMDHGKLIDLLENEVRYKKGIQGKIVGF